MFPLAKSREAFCFGPGGIMTAALTKKTAATLSRAATAVSILIDKTAFDKLQPPEAAVGPLKAVS